MPVVVASSCLLDPLSFLPRRLINSRSNLCCCHSAIRSFSSKVGGHGSLPPSPPPPFRLTCLGCCCCGKILLSSSFFPLSLPMCLHLPLTVMLISCVVSHLTAGAESWGSLRRLHRCLVAPLPSGPASRPPGTVPKFPIQALFRRKRGTNESA